MKLISHRGNVNGKTNLENNPEHIKKILLDNNCDVEIDVWFQNNNYYLGHDEPIFIITKNFLYEFNNRLWCHCKNINALFELKNEFNCFWNQNDDYALTSKGYIWVYPGKKLIKNSIALFDNYTDKELELCYGICSDNIMKYIGKL